MIDTHPPQTESDVHPLLELHTGHENFENIDFLVIRFLYLLGLYTRWEARYDASGMFSSGSIEQISTNGLHSTLRSLGRASKKLKIRAKPTKPVLNEPHLEMLENLEFIAHQGCTGHTVHQCRAATRIKGTVRRHLFNRTTRKHPRNTISGLRTSIQTQ